jgi:hypothetical protein
MKAAEFLSQQKIESFLDESGNLALLTRAFSIQTITFFSKFSEGDFTEKNSPYLVNCLCFRHLSRKYLNRVSSSSAMK